MLQHPRVPAQYAGIQTAYLLYNSEFFFPPLNAACTLSNIVLTAACYLHRTRSAEAAAKLRYVALASLLSAVTTVYALGIMVPMNRRMTDLAGILAEDAQNAKSEREFRGLQRRWIKLNYGKRKLFPRRRRSIRILDMSCVTNGVFRQAVRRL